MQTIEQVKAEFLGKLKALLGEYGATIEAEDHYPGYAECGSDIRTTVDIPSVYENGDIVRPWTEIDLGRYFTSETE